MPKGRINLRLFLGGYFIMKKISMLFACILVLAFATSAFAYNGAWQMYVRNREFKGMKVIDSKFYVPVRSFFDALKYGYSQEDGFVAVTRDNSVKENFSIPGNSLNCSFDGRTFVIPVTKISGSSYANVDVLTTNFNLAVTKTTATRIIDVMDKVGVAKHQENIARTIAYEKAIGKNTPSDDGTKKEGSANYDREKPVVQVGEVEGFLDQTTTWEARWNVKVKNEADEAVHNVMLILHIQDGQGNDVDQLVKTVGTMNPGETNGGEYYWQSKNHIVVFPKLEIKHTPLPKLEKKEGVETKAAPQESKDAAPAEQK